MAESSLSRILKFVAALVFLGVGGYLVYYFLGQPSWGEVQSMGTDLAGQIGDGLADLGDVLSNLTGIDWTAIGNNDPFLSDNTTSSWPTTGTGGLQLTILSALDSRWDKEFTNAISDWDNGKPDALTLTTEYGDVDHNCTPVDGLMKVCNGNWGETGWLGINEIVKTVVGSVIQNSVAKMNEYYLYNAEYAQRQYTMCHEVGHGFGLPHTDESFTNADTYNCLDYTMHPADNMHPNVTNFRRLVSLYGVVGQNRYLRDEPPLSSTLAPQQQRQSIFTPELMEAYQTAIQELEHEMKPHERKNLLDYYNYNDDDDEDDDTNNNNNNEDDDSTTTGWRKLSEHPMGADYMRMLSEDYVLHVHMNFPPPGFVVP